MVAGEGVVFADLIAPDGVLEYPFTLPGQPRELRGREAIRSYFVTAPGSRQVFAMDGVEAVVRETDDPEVVVTEIEHHGRSLVTGEPYRSRALGVIRVRNGQIVHYQDYMDAIATAGSSGAPPTSPPLSAARRSAAVERWRPQLRIPHRSVGGPLGPGRSVLVATTQPPQSTRKLKKCHSTDTHAA